MSTGKAIVLEMSWRLFSSIFSFCKIRQEATVYENLRFTDYASGIRLPDCSELAINLKNVNDVTIF